MREERMARERNRHNDWKNILHELWLRDKDLAFQIRESQESERRPTDEQWEECIQEIADAIDFIYEGKDGCDVYLSCDVTETEFIFRWKNCEEVADDEED